MTNALGARSALLVAALLTLAACTGDARDGTSHARFNGANTSTVNPSHHPGGILRYAMPSVPDSFDPGNTYGWNAARLWSRALATYRPLPGPAGAKLVPDLATTLGRVSDGGRTWTYQIRAGLKYSDGSPITTADVKYAVERSTYAPEVLSHAPNYFRRVLIDNSPPYKGPYVDKTGDLKSIQTLNDTTIVFHLVKPFADFDYLASSPQTAPVPRAKDDGAEYVKHVVSSGSYMVKSYRQNRDAVLVRNPYWDPASDPIRKQYPDQIRIAFNHDQGSIDDDLLAGNLDLDFGGNGMAASNQQDVLSDPSKKANADNVPVGAIDMLSMSTKVKPFDDIDCRRAVQYGVDKVGVQNAIGGPLRGEIASSLLPPTIPGHEDFDPYPTKHRGGDLAKARAALVRCGHPKGFHVGLATMPAGEQPALQAAAVSIQASLKRIGIEVSIRSYPSLTGWTSYFGAPVYAHAHDLGLMVTPWIADWADGYGFLEELIDGRNILPSGNTNLAELNDTHVNELLDAGMRTQNISAREKIWAEVDRAVMARAVIVPLVYRKELTYRPPTTTNVTISVPYGGYDLLNVGTA
jgi:peptide/nickel transport system substrate-binding protein